MSFCVVLEGTSPDVQLPIEISEMEAFTLSAALTGIQFAWPLGPQFAAGCAVEAEQMAIQPPAGLTVRRARRGLLALTGNVPSCPNETSVISGGQWNGHSVGGLKIYAAEPVLTPLPCDYGLVRIPEAPRGSR